MSDIVKMYLSIVLITTILILLLRNSKDTAAVIGSISNAVSQNVSVLQGNGSRSSGMRTSAFDSGDWV